MDWIELKRWNACAQRRNPWRMDRYFIDKRIWESSGATGEHLHRSVFASPSKGDIAREFSGTTPEPSELYLLCQDRLSCAVWFHVFRTETQFWHTILEPRTL